MKKEKIVMAITIGISAFVLVAVTFMQFKVVQQTDITSIETMTESELRSELIAWREKYSELQLKHQDVLIKIEEYKEGDYLFTYKIGSDRVPTVQLGKVGAVYADDDAIAFENGETYSSEFVAGVPTKKYEKIGGFLSIVESKWGFLFIVLIPVFLIFIYEVYALIIEIKYGAHED
jgi:hypothetical protein